MNALQTLARKLDSEAVPRPVRALIGHGMVLVHDFGRCDLLKQASAMAYVTLLSLIPSLVAIFCVLSLFSPLVGNGANLIEEIQDFILDNLASGTDDQVAKYLDHMLGNLSLAKIGLSSFASVLITLILLLRQIELALNRIWLVHKGRNVFARFMYFWTFMTLGMVVIGLGIGLTSGFDAHAFLTVSTEIPSFGHAIATWLAAVLGGFIFFFFLYKVVPNCLVSTRAAAIGAGIAAIVLNQAVRLFGVYVKDAHNYQTLYGALALLPIFLLSLYMYWVIILLGALISWRIQEGFPTEKDEATIDLAKTPTEQLRNVQVQAAMPFIALVAIYRHFREGSGKGLNGQQLAHALRLPASWVGDALEALESMGYVIAASGSTTDAGTVKQAYFPAFPADTVPVAKLRTDLVKPMDEWMEHWHHDLPINLRKAVAILTGTTAAAGGKSLQDALAAL